MTQLLQAVFRAPSASLSTHDDEMTASLEGKYEFSKGEAAAVKKLFTKPLADLRKVVGKARAFHRDHTFQGIGPTRLIVTGEQELYSTGMSKHLAGIRAAASRFIADYPTLLDKEKVLKGKAFKPDDYPAIEKFQERFCTEFLIMPMPEPGDFLKSLAGDAAEKLKKDYEAALKHTTENVRQQVLGRMLKLIAETAESLASDGPIIDNENKKGPLAKLREYLDRVPQLVVATANDVTKLDSALVRKGRFDELFFVDLPDAAERAAIWKIQIRKYGRDPEAFDLAKLAALTEGCTGSEIEALFQEALYLAFDADREPKESDVAAALKEFVPLSKMMTDDITRLQNWAKGRARRASAIAPTVLKTQRKLAA